MLEVVLFRESPEFPRATLQKLVDTFQPCPFEDEEGNRVGVLVSVRMKNNRIIGTVRIPGIRLPDNVTQADAMTHLQERSGMVW